MYTSHYCLLARVHTIDPAVGKNARHGVINSGYKDQTNLHPRGRAVDEDRLGDAHLAGGEEEGVSELRARALLRLEKAEEARVEQQPRRGPEALVLIRGDRVLQPAPAAANLELLRLCGWGASAWGRPREGGDSARPDFEPQVGGRGRRRRRWPGWRPDPGRAAWRARRRPPAPRGPAARSTRLAACGRRPKTRRSGWPRQPGSSPEGIKGGRGVDSGSRPGAASCCCRCCRCCCCRPPAAAVAAAAAPAAAAHLLRHARPLQATQRLLPPHLPSQGGGGGGRKRGEEGPKRSMPHAPCPPLQSTSLSPS